MDKKIKVEIFGIEDEVPGSCESALKSSSSKGCSNCKGCGSHGCHEHGTSSESKNLWQVYEEIEKFIKYSDASKNVIMEFIDIKRDGIENYKEIEKLLLEGYNIPIIVIDGIVRYYGGISKELIYKDIKELLQ